jgi:hypothetical protein
MVSAVKGANPYATRIPNPPNPRPEGRNDMSVVKITETPKLAPPQLPFPTTQVEFKTIGRFINTTA